MSSPWPARARPRTVRWPETSESPRQTLSNWLKKAEIEEGTRPGMTEADRDQMRELKKRNRLLEQENEVLRRASAYLSQANLRGK